MVPLSEARLAELLDYCHIAEPDAAERRTIEVLYHSAVGYLEGAGVRVPEADSLRRAQYDLCVNYLVLDACDRREATLDMGQAAENPAFRRLLNQLKLTETG